MNTQTISQIPRATLVSGSASQTSPTTASAALGVRSGNSASSSSRRLKDAQNALQTANAANAVYANELLSLPAQVVSNLPSPVRLHLRVPGTPVPVVLWTGRARAQARTATPVLADMIVFDGTELDAIVSACEADRLWHSDFLGLCFEKWRRPEVPVRSAELLGGANPDEQASWTLARVLTRLGLEVESIELDDQEPVARSLYEAA